MAASSNRSLWQVVTGHSALRDHALIERELRDSLTRLREGVAYYRPPSPASEKKIRDGGKLKGNKLTLVLEISSHLQLDQEQALELFEGFLINAHRGTLGELRERVRSEGGRREVVEEVASYYYSERLHLLRCLKHMLGFWQDPNHPFRDVYSVCIGEITKDEKSFIKSLWSQYQAAVDNDLPSQLSASEETQWSVQRLVEQVELLEAILLYYKDFVHEGVELVCHARQLWKNGCGLRQSCPVSLVDGAELLQRHIGHLCSLILVESLDLESILAHLEDPGALEDHHLLKFDSSSEVEQLDDLFSKWGDQDCLTPVLLSWALLQFAKQQSHTDLEDVRLLGNRALSGGVFQYIRCLLDSPFFSRERPVGGACRSVLHALLALALSLFSDNSLGDRQDLVAIASLTLTHPPLRLQFWDQGLSVGVGLLVNSSLNHFPSSSSLTSLLLSLAGDQVSAGHVWQLLASLPRFTEILPHREIGTQVKVVTADEGEAPMLKVIKPRSFYTSEARWLGLHGVVLGNGVCGEVWEGWEGEELVSWPLPHSVSGWDLLALEIVRLLQTSPLDSSTDVLVARVTGTIRLVTQLVKSDWSLAAELHRITTQAFSMLQRFAALPHPPTTLLASCVSCLAVMATNNTAETWLTLGQTGFLPYLSSSLPPSHDNLECLSVAPGNYGQLLKMAECPEGAYPVTMAMLDLLATTCLPGNSAVLREQLATVIYIMREVFLSCHKWKFKLRSGRRQLELGLLRFCHDTLQRHRDSPFSLGVVVATQLLSCPGEQGILPLLSLPVSTLNSLHSAALGTSSVSPAVESVRLSLSILNLLLHAPPTQQSSLLEWNLANTYPHIVSNIASYIYHYGDSRIPIGATAVLTRLCQATPLSVFSCVGTDAVVKRDVFISRLSSRVEEEELKRGVLGLLTEAVSSQPALAELFLCVQSSSSQGQVKYSLGDSSCLRAVMKIVSSPSSPPLLPPSLHLLRSLWHGRRDAVLHALRGIPSFWKNVTTPLSDPPSFSSHTPSVSNELPVGVVSESSPDVLELTNQMMAACHVMHIIAMEMYYVIQDKLDDGLQSILKDFVSKDGIKNWNECLLYPAKDVSQSSTAVLQAQHQLVIGWKTFLMVASSNQPALFGFPSPSSHPSPSPPSPPTHIITDIVCAVESQLAAPVSMTTVAMATELSLLMMVLIKKWKSNLPGSEVGNLIGQFSHMMPHVVRLDSTQASSLCLHLYTSAHLLLSLSHTNKVSVETRFLLGLVPFLSHTLRCHHDNSKGPSHRPDVQAVCLLSEMVGGVSDWSPWLLTFRNESLIPLLIQLVDERLKMQTDEALIEAILGVFVAMASSQLAAEALLVSGLLQVLSLPLASCLDNKLNPAPLTSKLPGTPVLKPHPPTTWSSVWQLSLRVAGLMCHTLSHLSLPSLLDFVGTHQLRITQGLDVMVAITSLSSLETTSSSLFFLCQLLRHRRQLCFSLPSFHDTALSASLSLLAAVATILCRRATLKHIVKTMHAAGLLPSNYCPPPTKRGCGKEGREDIWTSGCGLNSALTQLQSGLLSTLLSCLAIVQHFSPSLSDIVTATTQLDRDEYPCLFLPAVTPPTVDQTTPPSLGALTTCLSIGLELMRKVDPHQRVSGTPNKSKSPAKTPSSKSPSKSPRPLTPAERQRQREAVAVMERSAVLCVGQSLCALASHAHSAHDLQLMSKELANELSTFCHSLLLMLNRRNTSSASSQTPPTSFQEAWSGKAGLAFSETKEQVVFRVTDSFIKQLLSLH